MLSGGRGAADFFQHHQVSLLQVLVVGDSGLGKTTLVKTLLSTPGERLQVGVHTPAPASCFCQQLTPSPASRTISHQAAQPCSGLKHRPGVIPSSDQQSGCLSPTLTAHVYNREQ